MSKYFKIKNLKSKIPTEGGKGFTLIELLVVIALIGLLASIVIVSLQGPRATARDTKRQGDIRNIGTAMELCYGDSDCGGAEAYISSTEYPSAIGEYLVVMPDDPQGTGYNWEDNTSDDQEFCVWALLEEADADEDHAVASHVGFFLKATQPTADDPTSCEDDD